MTNALRHIALLLVLLAVAVLFGYVVGYNRHEKEISEETETHVTIIERDTIIYNFVTKDSTIIDWHLKPVEHFTFDTIHDTAFVLIPISSYHFGNEFADVWCKGYDVTLDSIKAQYKTVYETLTITIKETARRNFVGVEAGFCDASIIYIRNVGRLSLGISAGYTFDRHATARGLIGYNF